ncbi:Ger(x)C family spore germination protein [Neobacillus niacini]|uniref:Ger(x)C family spore germination protein n=1 Tax=Neobacillus niacini TaxID=86668 RepID=UPI002FFF1E05
MKKKEWVCIFLSISLLFGCAEPKILDRLGLITTVGYDLGKNGSIKGTLVELKIDPNTPKDVVIVESEALSIRGIVTSANKKTSRRLTSGQLRVIIYGEDMLKQGKTKIAQTLTSDPTISDMTFLAMTDGKARDLLNLKIEHIPDIGIHIFRFMEQNTKAKTMPSSTMQEVLHTHYTVGKEPVMPIISKNDNKGIVFSGVAIFKGAKLVGKINTDQSFYLGLINDKYKSGSKDVVIRSDSPKLKGGHLGSHKTVAALDSIQSSSNIKLINKEKPEFALNIKLSARLLEITSAIDVGNPQNMKLIEKEIGKSMKKDIENLIAYCQSKNSDVFGLGDIYRRTVRHSNLTDEKWYKMYKNAKVNIKVDFTVKRTGLNE